MKKVDFSDAEKRRDEINSLVEEITENHIKDLLPEGSVTAVTNLLLANAAFFKGSWATKFNNQLTEKKTFNGISPVEVDMMSVTGRFRYGMLNIFSFFPLNLFFMTFHTLCIRCK